MAKSRTKLDMADKCDRTYKIKMDKKIVFMDLTALYGRKWTGIERYSIILLKAISELEGINLYKICRVSNCFPNYGKTLVIPFKKRILAEQIFIPIILIIKKPNIVIFPCFPPAPIVYLLKYILNFRIFVIIHDTVIWNYAETLSLKAKIYLKPLYNIAIKRADVILTVSEYVANELRKLSSRCIVNISNSIGHEYENVDDIDTDILIRLNLKPEEYFLTVSTLEPRKNLGYLIELFEKLKNYEKNIKLIIVGKKGWGASYLMSKIKDKRDIIWLGYIPIEDLITLYKYCDSFILLSLYEGFGLPPLEALACGARIIVSDIPIFKETVGNYGIYIPLNNMDKAINIIRQRKNKKKEKVNIYNAVRYKKIIKQTFVSILK